MTEVSNAAEYMALSDEEQDAFDRKYPNRVKRFQAEGLEVRESPGNRARRERREREDAAFSGNAEDDEE